MFSCVQGREKVDPIFRMMLADLRSRNLAILMMRRFIYAPNARDRLNVTYEMMQRILSYHQCMPALLESVFSFGFREHSIDCTMTSFQSRNPFFEEPHSLSIEELKRSAMSMEYCYGLRSVEPSKGQVEWPWSIRLCSVYHSLDLETAQAAWIVLKANRLIEKLVRDAMASKDSGVQLDTSTVTDALSATFQIHQLVAIWSGSNWSSYVSFLEDSLQELTRPTLAVTMEDVSTNLAPGQITELRRVGSPTQISLEPEEVGEKPTVFRKTRSSLQAFSTRLRTFRTEKSPTQTGSTDAISVTQHQFSFRDLPRVHYIEEKANEALEVLLNNEEVLEESKRYYTDILDGLELDTDAKAFRDSVNSINRVQKDLRTQQRRLRQPLRLLGNRKTLVCIAPAHPVCFA